MQRQNAFGLPPSGCENYVSQRHYHYRIPPLSVQKKSITSLPSIPQKHLEVIRSAEKQKNINYNKENLPTKVKCKMYESALPSQFTVYPYKPPLIKPRSEDSLLNCNCDCPCPFCQSDQRKLSTCANNKGIFYQFLTDNSNSCSACSNKMCNEKNNSFVKTYVCIICRSNSNCCQVHQNLIQKVCCKDHELDTNGNFNCMNPSRCKLCTGKIEDIKKSCQKGISFLPQKYPKFNSTETLCSADSGPVDQDFQNLERPRRMSERDIPSKLINEHVQDNRLATAPGHIMPPRMQSSKSVPSLSSNHDDPVHMQPNGNMRPHDMYNPAYSRTSSTASIPKAADYSDHNARSKSSNNLQEMHPDSRMQYGNLQDEPNPPPYPGPPAASMNSRSAPHMNMHQGQPNMHPPPQVPSIPPVVQEERHYQNISVYQQQSSVQAAQQANAYPVRARSPTQQPRSLHGSQSSLNRPEAQPLQSPVDRSRPLSTLVSPREQEQYANSMGYVHPNAGPPRSPKVMHHNAGMDPHHVPQGYVPPRPLHDQREFRSADHLRPVENDARPYPDSMSHPELSTRAYPMHTQEHNMMHTMDPRQRDLLRQEAKMEEMREEVRRREDRERMLLQQQQNQMGYGGNWPLTRAANPPIRPPSNYHHSPHQGGHPHPPYAGAPPPPAPKPRPQFFNSGVGDRFQRPPGYMNAAETYHETPAGHPHPQTSRIPHQPPPVISYRYGPSGYPPRSENGDPKMNHQMANDPRISAAHGKPPPVSNQNSRVTFELPHSSGSDKKEASNLMSPSPWEREEKEKLNKQKQEEIRRARDEEIRDLESRTHLTTRQEDRLRTLRLEQEFQRRADELRGEEDDDDDDDLLDRAENRERKLKMQEDLERARQRRLEWEMQQNQNQIKYQPQNHNEDWKRQQQSLEEQEGRLRHLRLEEVQRKMELEMAKNAEERLLREARRRQDELKVPNNVAHQIPNRPSQPPTNHQFMPNNQQHLMDNHQNMRPEYISDKSRIDNSNHQDVPPPLPTSPPPSETSFPTSYNQKPPIHGQRLNDGYQNQSHQNSVQGHEKNLEPPAPPARKSSYEVTNQMSALSSSSRYAPSSMRNCDNSGPHYPKKVSFHDSSQESGYDANGNHDVTNSGNSQSYTLDDINEVLATPHNSQNLNTYNPGNTPGVIGTQEVYRDPRQRIEAERIHQERGTMKNPGPEKLTFKEKMKMFAQEVGEPETPKDKVKISRAQRDIETNLNGS